MVRFTLPAILKDYCAGKDLMEEAIKLGLVMRAPDYNGIPWYTTDQIDPFDLVDCGFYVLGYSPWL